ncbi:MAG: HAD family hydrolase [Candidatus Aenigmatarchaeota archaeon]
MPIKVVAFDLWNTLVYDPSSEIHERIANILGFNNRQEFWDYCDKNFFGRKMTFYEFLEEFLRKNGIPLKKMEEIKELWEEARNNVKLFPSTIKTLRKLKKKYKLVLLSNTAGREGRETIERFGLGKYFDEIIISGEVGIAKPDPRIFQLILDRMKVKPEEVVYIGDNLEQDIVPSRYLGFRAILVDTRQKYPEYMNEEWYVRSLEEIKMIE